VISQCEALADVVRGLGYIGPLAVIGNPVAPGAADVDAVRLAGEPCLVGVGRLANQKGFDVAVEALPEIVSRFPGAVLHLVGDGPDREALGDLAAHLRVTEHVEFHGGRTDVVAVLKGSDLVVAPSRYEGFSNVILEAQSVGTPVVATSCPGAAHDVLDYTSGGVLVPPDSADELAAAVTGLLAEPDRFDRVAIAGRTAGRWSAERIADEYDRFLSEIAVRHDGVTSEVPYG
jgi:glycosyltransferase involved in cell wall biosynthesis